jgi:hypothetical protein
VVQQPTEGDNPALTQERMRALGLRPTADPDLLVEDRVWDIYAPLPSTDARGVAGGIASKIKIRQTDRVAVDLRSTSVTEVPVRAALRAEPLRGLKEVITLTEQGLGRPFRP